MAFNRKLAISLPVLAIVIISVIITTMILNNNGSETDSSLSAQTNTQKDGEEKIMNKIYATINNQKLEINLEDNSTTAALVKLLPLDLSMNDLNDNEKYAYMAESLPTNTYSPKHINAGDVMLYGDNCLVIFYKSFDTSYNYSKIGHIDNLPKLGDGNITINLSTK